MLNLAQQKPHSAKNKFAECYNILDKTASLILKITFPLWIMPYLSILLVLKVVNFWKHAASLLTKLFRPHLLSPLSYAILKGNGQYLRDHHQQVLTRQFYDYTSRKFMRLSELDSDSHIVEIQCDNDIGLSFFSEIFQPRNVKGLISSKRLLKNLKNLQQFMKQTNYIVSGQSMQVDCFLFFNFKSKVNFLGNPSPNLINILNYCSYHLNKQGYIVFGDYFEKGEINTFQSLFKAYNLTITDQEDITKNIDYAKKLLLKDRNKFEVKIISIFSKLISNFLRIKPYEHGKSFHVFILENKAASDHS